MLKLLAIYDRLRGSLWFVPTVIVALLTSLGATLVELEGTVDREELIQRFPRLFGAGADASRGLLSAIAGSMITVAGVSFSITVVTLTLASSQYSSRVVGNFMRDRANQTVLGVFLGIFAYCLVVLRTVRSGDEGRFVPALAVLVALALAFVAIGHLIFFIHHVAASIQASSIIATTTRETLSAIERLFPEPLGEAAQAGDHQRAALAAVAVWEKVRAPRSGYLQAVDADRLFRTAKTEQVVIRLERAIGEFVTEGSVIASTSRAPSEDGVEQVKAAFAVGKQRTLQQDAAYGITQLVDVALRALSPGINDTTTAVHCVDYLGVILARLVDRRLIDPYRSDGGELRVVARGPTFPDLLGEAFGELRRAAPSNVTVIIRLLQVLNELRTRATHVENRRAIEAQSALIADSAALNVPNYDDRCRIDAVRRADAA